MSIIIILFSLSFFILYCITACKTKEDQALSDAEQIKFIRKHKKNLKILRALVVKGPDANIRGAG